MSKQARANLNAAPTNNEASRIARADAVPTPAGHISLRGSSITHDGLTDQAACSAASGLAPDHGVVTDDARADAATHIELWVEGLTANYTPTEILRVGEIAELMRVHRNTAGRQVAAWEAADRRFRKVAGGYPAAKVLMKVLRKVLT